MRKINVKLLKSLGACRSGIVWLMQQGSDDPEILFRIALQEKRYSDINWLLPRLMNKRQRVMYAVSPVESVLGIYEKKYPNDKRPRKAIEAAKEYLKRPGEKTKAEAYDAAKAAADAYAYTPIFTSAAAVAKAAADVASVAYVDTAASVAYAASAAYAAAKAAKKELWITILQYGFDILNKKS